MKYLLAFTLLCYVLTWWAYKSADRPGDDFGAALPFIVGGMTSICVTVIYVGLAFWYHRFW